MTKGEKRKEILGKVARTLNGEVNWKGKKSPRKLKTQWRKEEKDQRAGRIFLAGCQSSIRRKNKKKKKKKKKKK